MVSHFVLSFFSRDALDEIWDCTESYLLLLAQLGQLETGQDKKGFCKVVCGVQRPCKVMGYNRIEN